MIRQFRWGAARIRDYMPMRGLGWYYQYGSLGSTYGEEGSDMSFHFVILLWRPYEIWARWKKI